MELGRLRDACRCEQVVTNWLSTLVASACRVISFHLSALHLVPLLLAVDAFALELAGRFVIFLLVLAALSGLAFAAFTGFAFVEPLPSPCRSWPPLTCTASTCIAFGSAHAVRPAVIDDLVTKRLVRSHPTDTQIDVLFQSLVRHATAYDSVHCGIADDIVGLLVILRDVTLE